MILITSTYIPPSETWTEHDKISVISSLREQLAKLRQSGPVPRAISSNVNERIVQIAIMSQDDLKANRVRLLNG